MATQNPSTQSEDRSSSLQSAWQNPEAANRYKNAENATRPFAKIMVDLSEQLTTLKSTPVSIFDLACGTGAVEAELYAAVPKDQWSDLQILAGDISEPMLEYLAQRGKEEGWSGLQTKIVDGKKLEEADFGEGLSRVFVGFAIFVLPLDTVPKLAQKLAPGGTLAVTTWAYPPWFGFLQRAMDRLQDGPVLPSQTAVWAALTTADPWQESEFVRGQLLQAGLQKVEVVQKKENVDCGTPETFMASMKFVISLLSKGWPEEKRERWLEEVVESMTTVITEECGGADKHVFMEFEGIVGVGLKGE
ncbi:hypothetical protein OPT61_g147 [Boeremia exigua]|uniref:Uncharacterized protein n=1 Tax=Boeremia exigua TaxID=749465 RepID=A0ACC2IV46_9PLEO|nr:hypothetical protein OPT61_g147 [Boeremia exigua]